MENNLEDILVDNIEEKPSSNSKLRMIIIGVASVVLLAVLGVLAYVLLKKDQPKNPEFNNTELEKIAPAQQAQPAEDDLDKLIAQIKNKDAQEQETQAPLSHEIQKSKSASEKNAPSNVANTPSTPKAESKTNTQTTQSAQQEKTAQKPLASQTQKAEVKPTKAQEENSAQTPKTKKEAKVAEKKTEKTKAEKVEKKAPSASKAFESIKTDIVPKGFYLQVGVFGGKPQATFVSKLSSLPYKTQTLQKGGKVLTRYLVGPYATRQEAEEKMFAVMQTMGVKPVIAEIK